MLISVRELCWVDYIKESEIEKETDEKLTAIRTVIYQSTKDTLLEAFKDYCSNNFNTDNIVSSNDEFEGCCLDTIKYISVEEV